MSCIVALIPWWKSHNRGSIAPRSRFDRTAILEFFRESSWPSDEASGEWTIVITRSSVPPSWGGSTARWQSTVRWRFSDDDLRDRAFAMNLVSFIRWRLDAPCASTRRQMIGKSTSLKSDFVHVHWWMIAWTQVHAIDASVLDQTLALMPRQLQEINVWEHSPTRNKKEEMSRINKRY